MTDKAIEKLFKLPPVEVLLRLPARYIDVRQVQDQFHQLSNSDSCVIYGTIESLSQAYSNRTTVIRGTLVDRMGIRVGFSHFDKLDSPYGRSLNERIGKPTYFECKTKVVGTQLYVNTPQPIEDALAGKIIPLYSIKSRKMKGFEYAKELTKIIESLIPRTAEYIRHQLAALNLSNGQIRRCLQAQRLTLDEVLYKVHFPESFQEAQQCNAILQRIAATLLLSGQDSETLLTDPFAISVPWDKFNHDAPFTLTDEQNDAVKGIVDCFNAKKEKSVLFGDVGTGKTVVGAMVSRLVVESGGRVAIMVPNVVLATQIYQEVDAMWPEVGIELLLSASEVKEFSQKGYRCVRQVSETTKIVIGTTALINNSKGIEFDLLWIDEEQKLGIGQKESHLITKGKTHLLLSSATCIPRTQAMMMFGMVPYFKLTKYHTPREVITTLYQPQDTALLVEKVEQHVSAGEKVLVISTRKTAGKEDNEYLANAEALYADWRQAYGDIVQLSHGGLSKRDNELAINEMKTGQGQILIATTLIEVGVTIPGLKRVVVLNPENLGAVTLHQIRGRVSRSGGVGYCDLLPTKPLSEDSLKRLKLVERHPDGFTLAEADMQLRGMGDLKNGQKQSGESKCILIDQKLSLELITETVNRLDSLVEMEGK